MLFDSHTHINNDTFSEEERSERIKEIEKSDVSLVMDIGFDLASSIQAVKDAESLPWCYAAVGVHPHDTKSMNEEMLNTIKELAQKDKVKAIGEIGLDFHYNHSEGEDQRKWFRRQIQLANELKMPIVIHSREADGECMEILKEEGAFAEERCKAFEMRKGPGGELKKDARVLLHCFSGSKELALEYLKLGATISVAGPLTYKNNKKTVSVVEAVPLEFLLAETDAPYLSPEPFRGRPNRTPYVEYTVRKIAEIKGIEYEEAARQTAANAKHFFNITE